MTENVNADYVSSPEAAKILRITYVGVAQLARQGKIPAVKIANRWLIPRAFLEEFARTYEGRRGRPRKNRLAGCPGAQPEVQPSHASIADSNAAGVRDPGRELGEVNEVRAPSNQMEEMVIPVPPAELAPPEPTGAIPPGDSRPEAASIQALDQGGFNAADYQPVESPTERALPVSETQAPPEPQPIPIASTPAAEPETDAVPEASGAGARSGNTFSIRAEMFHLDGNYDFEVYEKGQITERARLIVARLKPKIPSLPQFSFRWDYRYEHLNVDIHGVEPAVSEWWTMGENGYTGHLPRRLGGQGYAFEAIIWLPVTFVFRGRLTLSLQGSPEAREDSSSAPVTTGGLRRLWTKWSALSGNT